MQRAIELVVRVHEDAVRQRDFATGEAHRLGLIASQLRERISGMESEASAMRAKISAQATELEN